MTMELCRAPFKAMITGRRVLILDAAGTMREALAGLAAHGLDARHVRSLAQAQALADSAAFDAALAVFDARSELAPDAVERLAAMPSTADWIALVDPSKLGDTGFRAFVLRAFLDHHTLPVDTQRLAVALGHACGRAALRRELDGGTPDDAGAAERFGICGTSPAMHALFHRLAKVVEADAPVLIGGETGTGKELVAHAIHRHSRRADGPMIAVNCAAIPATLIQSELFGHEKSAFTGATQRKIGRIEAASGGVLFLDEIGDLPLDMQASLLRVLQDRAVIRVGANRATPVDFRVIAATHVDLAQAVRRGAFREDLYFRLKVLQLVVPPLRERGDDVLRLAELFRQRFAAQHAGARSRGFAADGLRAMQRHDWPGNVRELINRIQEAVVMGDSRLISAADLGLEPGTRAPDGLTLDDARARFERELLASSLRANGNQVSKTARQLGVSRVTLYRMLHRLNLRSGV
jgi:DNA-binding NtrC family response regulator